MLAGLALANLSVLSMLPLWLAMVLGSAIWVLQEHGKSRERMRPTVIWVSLGLLPMLFGLLLGWEMRRRSIE